MSETQKTVSALVVVHNEEDQLAACLDCLSWADELVVVLDKCFDGSRDIAARYTDKLIEGSWDLEGPRRNIGLEACTSDWIFEVDADERVSPELGAEIKALIQTTPHDWHEILVDNYIGERLVRWGWGASYGKAAYPGLFKNGWKRWGNQRVHPSLEWKNKNKGPFLEHRLVHYVDRNISDMIRRLDSYATARAKDWADEGRKDSFANNFRRFVSRFFKCYFLRKGYKEGGYGFLIALFAGLFPLLSYLKQTYEEDAKRR